MRHTGTGWGRRRARGLRLGLFLLASASAGLDLLATPGAGAGVLELTAPPLPLAGAVTTTTSGFAVVVMGKNDGNFDLFWQLFAVNPANGRWSLVTPPGVADNGGLMVAPTGQKSLLVGFGASQGLLFSPLAYSADGGTAWSPGGLADPLAADPSAVALGPGGRALALVVGSDEEVLTRSGSLTSWSAVVSRRALATTTAGKACGLTSLDAVAIGPNGSPLVGASCARPGSIGIFVDKDARWQLAGLPVPSRLAGASFEVVRLSSVAGVTDGLLLAGGRNATVLLATWAGAVGGSWTVSPALELHSGERIVASGTGPTTSAFVLLKGPRLLRAEVVGGPGLGWRELPPLPVGTATLAFGPGGRPAALAVDDTVLTVWQLATAAKSWVRAQRITVPIVFGSSS